jgi:hypothetical protein
MKLSAAVKANATNGHRKERSPVHTELIRSARPLGAVVERAHAAILVTGSRHRERFALHR